MALNDVVRLIFATIRKKCETERIKLDGSARSLFQLTICKKL